MSDPRHNSGALLALFLTVLALLAAHVLVVWLLVGELGRARAINFPLLPKASAVSGVRNITLPGGGAEHSARQEGGPISDLPTPISAPRIARAC